MNKRILAVLAGAGITVVTSTAALAAEPGDKKSAPAGSEEKLEEIVVTGTLIRGAEAIGANVIGVSQQKIEESGATTSGELLASIPQVGFFGTVPFGPSAIVGSNASNPISRPNLRNLPAAQTSGGAQTLVLVDGHRVVGAGTQQVGVDPDIIAPGAIEHVEALTDGGSAIYGSDALGGVINFITRQRFDGLELTARKGIAKDLNAVDGTVTVGKDWGSGGAYLSYSYTHHDDIFGADRDFIRRINYNTGVPVGRFCSSPNITSGGVSYVVSGTAVAAGGPVTCDQSDNTTVYPDTDQNNAFARIQQDFTDSLSFDMTALWARRESEMNGGTLGSDNFRSATTSSVTYVPVGTTPAQGQVANSLYRPIPGDATGVRPQTITFNYEPAFGPRSLTQKTELETTELAPSLTFSLPGDWQIRALTSYGESKVTYANRTLNAAAQAAALANGGGLNPYNIAASSPAALAAVQGVDRGYGKNKLYDYRVVADGPVLNLPAGAIKVAVGAEYMKDEFRRQTTNSGTNPFTFFPVAKYDQNVKSAFAEATVPIVGDSNAFTGVRELNLSVSGRYDKYNDFGDTTNPKIALNWKPIDSLTFDANWSKSFNAPSPVDQLGSASAQATTPALASQFLIPAPPGFTYNPADTTKTLISPTDRGIFLGNGAAANLQPQTAKSWSTGLTFSPPFVEGLTLHASYYTIKLDGTLGRPVGVDLTPFWTQFPNLYVIKPTGQQLASFLSTITAPNTLFTLCNPTSTAQATIATLGTTCATATPVGAAIDTLVRNLGETKLTGIDFDAYYRFDTSFGGVDFSVAGNRRLKQDTQQSPTSPVVAELDTNNPKLRMQTTVGTNIHDFRAQIAWNHTAGYDRAGGAVAANFFQGKIDAFDTIDLFFKYDVNGTGMLSDLSFSLNVQNVLDEDPPLLKLTDSTGPGFDPSLAFTLGRYFQLAAKKKF
jgi:iron complex outermembrane receptor protein